MHSLSIPRGVCILAGGKVKQENGSTIFEVQAGANNLDFGIVQSPFMQQKARTDSFTMKMTVGDNFLTYKETMLLNIYGKPFEHIDKSSLQKVAYPID